MRLLLVALLVLLAGCAESAVDPADVARQAPLALQQDQGPGGQLTSTRTTMGFDFDDARFTLVMQTRYFEGGEMGLTLSYHDVDVGDPAANRGMESMTLHVLCYPDRIRIQSDGMSTHGQEELDQEMGNPVGACVGLTEEERFMQAQAIADALSNEGFDAASLDQALGVGIPEHRFVSATADGNVVLADYVLVMPGGGDAITVTARIEDGRIQEESGVFSVEGFALRWGMSFDYGPRLVAP